MMEIAKILDILPHRYPFLLVDRIEEVIPGEKAVGIKNVTINEPFFQGHFPGFPVMPGVLIVETMAQVAGVLFLETEKEYRGKKMFLLGLDGVRFRKPVIPGDRMRVEMTVVKKHATIWKFDGLATVDGKRVAEGTLLASVAEDS